MTTASPSPRVTLVGAGPGDPELLTIKAVKAIRQATVLLVDDLVGDGVLRYARASARIVHVGKRGGCSSPNFDQRPRRRASTGAVFMPIQWSNCCHVIRGLSAGVLRSM